MEKERIPAHDSDRAEERESKERPGETLPSSCPYCGMQAATPHELLVHIFRCHPA